MNKFFTLLLAAACFTASAQIEVEYPYNPDNQNDGHVGIEDILEILTVYGEEFTPEQLMVEGTSLTEWIQLLSETVIQQQSQIDSLQGQLSNDDLINSEPWGITLGERVIWNLDTLDWQTVDFPSMDFAMIEAESDGLLHVSGNTSGYNPYRLSVIPEELLPCDDMSQCDGMLIQALFAGDEFEEFQYVDLWANDNALPLTIPIKKGELVCLRRESLTATWQRFIWTPFIPSATDSESNEGSENQAGPCQGELTVSYHGYEYELVEIGDQCWFAENLRTEYYQNGDPIDLGLPAVLNPTSAYMPAENPICGCVYNKAVIYDGRHVCPQGFHLPSVKDFSELLGASTGFPLIVPAYGWEDPIGFKAIWGNGNYDFPIENHCGTYHNASDASNISWAVGQTRFLTSSLAWTSPTSQDFPNGDPDEYYDFAINGTSYSEVFFGDLDNPNGQYIRCIKD